MNFFSIIRQWFSIINNKVIYNWLYNRTKKCNFRLIDFTIQIKKNHQANGYCSQIQKISRLHNSNGLGSGVLDRDWTQWLEWRLYGLISIKVLGSGCKVWKWWHWWYVRKECRHWNTHWKHTWNCSREINITTNVWGIIWDNMWGVIGANMWRVIEANVCGIIGANV